MALFQQNVIKRVTTEYVNQPQHPGPRRPNSRRFKQRHFAPSRQNGPVKWMENLDLLCHNDPVHPLPLKMVHIGTVADDTVAGGFRYIYACPFGRHNGVACQMREYWVLTPNGSRQIWRGKYNGH